MLEVVGALLDLVLVEHVAVGHAAVRAFGPDKVVDVVHILQVHRQTLEAVGDLAGDRPALEPAGLLEIGELGHLHAVEPHFPAEAPGAQRGRLPVVLDEAQIVHQRIEPELLQRTDVQLQDVLRVRLHHHLVLVIVLQAVRVGAVATVGGSARWLHIRGRPRLRTKRTQERGRMKRASADFDVERLQQHAALTPPVAIEGLDDVLEGACGHGFP